MRDPLIIGGETYPDWRPAGGGTVVIQANPDQTTLLMSNLGKALPGQLPDGMNVELLIYTVQGIGSGGSEVLAYVQADTGDLL